MKYILRSEYDCIVKSLLKEELLDKNSELVFDEPSFVLVYPLDNNFSPFSLDLYNPKSSFCKTLLQEDVSYVFLLNPPQIETFKIETFNFSGKSVKVFLGQNKLCFQSEKTEKHVNLGEDFKSYTCEKKDSFLLVHLVGKNEEMFCFNLETDKLTKLSGDKIEVLDKQIIVTKNLNLNFSQKTLETYLISKDKLEKISSSTKNEGIEHVDVTVTPYIFLDSIKNKNFDIATSLLDDNLKSHIKNENLESYFGEIISFFNLKNDTYCVFSKDKTSVYTFSLNHGKICEISTYQN